MQFNSHKISHTLLLLHKHYLKRASQTGFKLWLETQIWFEDEKGFKLWLETQIWFEDEKHTKHNVL